MRELRPYQARAIDDTRRAIGDGARRVCLQLPTGGGKTVIAAGIVNAALAKGRRVLFTVPAIALVDQTVERFRESGIDEIGVIQADHWMTDWSKPVQVASVQTLQRRWAEEKFPRSDLVIVDEAHKLFQLYGQWFGHADWQRVPVIGLSATPWAKGMSALYDRLLIGSTVGEMTGAGYLSPAVYYGPSHPDLSSAKIVAGDYREADAEAAMAPLTADVVTTWLRLGEDRPTILFAVNRAHARALQRQFEAAGVGAAYIDAYTPQIERKAIERRFHEGAIRVVCSVGTLIVGVDWDVRCVIFARPTRSEMLWVQAIGRGLRLADGKSDCIVLDHTDTAIRLGLVEHIHHTDFVDGAHAVSSGQKREKPKPLPKACPSCSYLKPPKVHECPSCGFAPEKQPDIEVADGDLVQIGGKPKKPEVADMATKQRWYSGFLYVAESRGYKAGWAANKYRDRFGVWPRGLDDAPMQPAADISSWIKSRDIAWAKSRLRVA